MSALTFVSFATRGYPSPESTMTGPAVPVAVSGGAQILHGLIEVATVDCPPDVHSSDNIKVLSSMCRVCD